MYSRLYILPAKKLVKVTVTEYGCLISESLHQRDRMYIYIILVNTYEPLNQRDQVYTYIVTHLAHTS
jgi:hypothetical protein